MPALLAPVLVIATAVGFSVQANAVPNLPDKTASQILQLINTNPEIAFSGRIIKKADLGLPPMNLIPNISQSMVDEAAKTLPKSLADFIPRASLQGDLALVLEFFAGTHTANIYVDGSHKLRLQVLDLMSERDYIRNGSNLWSYDAGKSLARHGTSDPADEVKAKSAAEDLFNSNSSKLPLNFSSPAQVADYLIAKASLNSTITVGADAKVAGRGVYQLTIAPNSSESLLKSATISVDAATGLPLAVRIMAIGQSAPAFEVAFESISFAKPASQLFDFTPPVGTRVEELATPTKIQELNQLPKTQGGMSSSEASDAATKLEAQGWEAVVVIPAADIPAQFKAFTESNKLYLDLTSKVSGGRIFSTALLNVFIADDGRVFIGALKIKSLIEAAASK